MKTYLINIIGGPGCGKSICATLLFAHLKMKGYIVEYAAEYAKTLIWQSKYEDLDNQYHVSRKQYELFKSMVGKVDFIVTDGTLLHGLYYNRYNKYNISNVEKTEKYIKKCYDEFNNINIFLERGDFEYENAGRQQTEEEAKVIDNVLREILDEFSINYKSMKLIKDDTLEFRKYILEQMS